MKKVVQLFTPGLDSYLANFFLTEQVKKGEIELHRLYFDLKSRYSVNELNFLTSFYSSDFFKILDTLKGLNDLQLSEVVRRILNTYRSKTSFLGVNLTQSLNLRETRNILL